MFTWKDSTSTPKNITKRREGGRGEEGGEGEEEKTVENKTSG
jgi:hypothetical protein